MEWSIAPLAALQELVSWRAIVDVLLLSAAVFWGYRALRAFGAQKLVFGLVLGGVLLMFASLFDLRGTEWILINVSQIALIALIVIFQPEIRRILESATRLGFFKRNLQSPKLPYMVDEVVCALAGRKWGAVIVFPGHDLLQRWVSEGIVLDAAPSLPLLVSLFDPNSPGHDGAVILEKGRVSRFGVRLPLSQSGRLSKDLGTRHAAGLGLSESTDALVVVVSEERGLITLFHRGEHTPIAQKGQLAAQVLAHTQGEPSRVENASIRRALWQRVMEVTASVGVAFLFWSTVVLSQTEPMENTFVVPIEFSNPPDGLALVEPRSAESHVRVSAPTPVLANLDKAGVRFVVDLAGSGPGRQTVPLTSQQVRVPRRVHVLSVEPQTLDVYLETTQEIELPVEPQLVGSPPKGWTLASAITRPAKIRVLAIGSDHSSDSTTRLLTTPVQLGTLRQSTTILGKIIPTQGLKPADKEWPDVEILVELRSESE